MLMLFSCNHIYILFNNFVIIFRLLHLSSLVPKYFCFLNCTKITVRQSRAVCDPPLLKWTISSERARLWTASFMQLRFCTYWWPCLELLQVDTYWLPGISTFFSVWRDLPVFHYKSCKFRYRYLLPILPCSYGMNTWLRPCQSAFKKLISWHPVQSLHGKQMGKQWKQ